MFSLEIHQLFGGVLEAIKCCGVGLDKHTHTPHTHTHTHTHKEKKNLTFGAQKQVLTITQKSCEPFLKFPPPQ